MDIENITFCSGGVELLDDIQFLWEKLNQHHAAISSHFSSDFLAKTFAGRKAALLKKYGNGKIRVEIAQVQGENIAYLISAICPDGVGEIESVYVDEGFRGQAIGAELMRRGLVWLAEQNAHTKVIEVAVGNERANAFYARFGFFPRVVTLKHK